ncbi:MAG TPA: MauE/DoxX family redox-associated membrane protein [Solirubrobacteraceae bacterium]|jgi:hypothetical protein|nr:MauE/DoxX family redox-associated membrane protein [Solirubrobacteraceae bacterium]
MSFHAALALVLASVLAAGGVAKLAAPARSAAGLSTFGLRTRRGQTAGVAGLIALELGLAAAVASGSRVAGYAAAVTMAAFAVSLGVVLHRGGAGAPCACFGGRSTVGRGSVARNVGLGLAYVGLAQVPDARVSAVGWLTAGLVLALVGLSALGLASVALAREIGVLRLRLGPQLALELADEGPELNDSAGLIDRFALDADARLALAVFSSEGCPMCRALGPAIDWLSGDPFVSVVSFDEQADADVWEALGIPGSPYAVVLDRSGTVLAKGTFNSGGQLEGMLASAERRAGPLHASGELGVMPGDQQGHAGR